MWFFRRASLSVIMCIFMVTLICYLLSEDNLFFISIDVLWSKISNYSDNSRIIAVGLLPIYVGLMIFGAAGLSFYLSALLRRFLNKT